jgi:aspartyl-tRNA(Asn)/glutamyl-tRNA(Gln) amidotransferase subunit A
MMEDVLQAVGVISLADAAAYHRDRLAHEPDRFGDDVRTRLERGAQRSAGDYALARQTGREWRANLQSLFSDKGLTVLALPTTPQVAPEIAGSEGVSAAKELLRFTYPISLSGWPALSMPCGFTSDGLPIGLQLVAPDESTLLSVAHMYQQVTDWYTRRPLTL